MQKPSALWRRIRRALPFFFGLALAVFSSPVPAADPFVVIVNAGNKISSLRVQEIADYFLKRTTAWPDGTQAAPVDLADPSPVRESFSERIHHKSAAAVRAYWQKMIFSGRDVPPPEKATPDEVVAFVRSHPGAIGYVPAGTALGSGVKVLVMKP
jgi:ABC-type phosphate transport system substrate-binding protein